MIIAWLGLVLSQLASRTFSVKVNITAFSTEFLLAFPKIPEPNIYLLMYTLAEEVTVTLSLTNPGSSDHTRLLQLSVRRSKSVQHLLDRNNSGMASSEFCQHNCLLLTSDQPFGLHVHMYDGQQSLSSFMAVPVHAFGRTYMVVTHEELPFFTVVVQSMTKLSISIYIVRLVKNKSVPKMIYNWKIVQMVSYQALTYMSCFDRDYAKNSSLSGSRIESGHPFGVISGSCSLTNAKCQEPDIAFHYSDMGSEMLLPEKMFRQKFVIAYLRQRSKNDFLLVAVSELNNTMLALYQTLVNTATLKTIFAWKYRSRNVNSYFVNNKPVAVYMIINITCQSSGDKGGPSISMVVPNDLFFNVYAWVKPPADNVVNFISLVLPNTSSVQQVLWNGGSIPYVNMSVDEGVVMFGYTIAILELGPTGSEAVLEASFNFGCYFSGLSKGSFFQAAGFFYQEEKYECSPSTPRDEDGQDNDCDGIVDEEYRNDLDDDGDALVDEDTYKVSDCNKTARWGKGCFLACSKYCVDNCNTHNGSCFRCVKGRTNLNNFCLDELGNTSTPGPVTTPKLPTTPETTELPLINDSTEMVETLKPNRTTGNPVDETIERNDSSSLLWVLILAPMLIGVTGSIYLNLRYQSSEKIQEESHVNNQTQDSDASIKVPSRTISEVKKGTFI